jgi:hypothetical protein
MVQNSEFANIAVIIRRDVQIVTRCLNARLNIENSKLFSTVLMLKYTGLYLNRIRIRLLETTVECTQRFNPRPKFMNQRSLLSFVCMF